MSATGVSHAGPMTLTPAGMAAGFSLTTFVSGFGVGGFGVGPLGMGVTNDGHVIVDASNLSKNYVFNDVDNQTLASAVSSTPFNGFPPAYAATGGSVYGSGGFSGSNAGKLIKFNNDGTINTVYNLPGLNITNGMWANPVNGHLVAGGGSGIYDIDVSGATPTFRLITGASSDGVTVSPDGTTVYTTGVTGYDIGTGAVVFPTLGVAGGPDGMGIITSTSSINGNIIVNTNGGTLVMIDPVSRLQTIIASGGTRGDYVSPDATNGTLLLTQSDEILRLSCGVGCAIGAPPPPPTDAPEPASVLLGGAGLVVLSVFAKRAKAGVTNN